MLARREPQLRESVIRLIILQMALSDMKVAPAGWAESLMGKPL